MRIDIQEVKERTREKFLFLATPYSNPSSAVRAHRAVEARSILGRLLAQGLWTYSPIWHCHQPLIDYSLPTSIDWWEKMSEAFITGSGGVVVACKMADWDKSHGVAKEILFAQSISRPVFYYDHIHLRWDDETPIA